MPYCETKKCQKQMGNSQPHMQPYPPCKLRGVDVQDKSVNVHNLILAISKGIEIQL